MNVCYNGGFCAGGLPLFTASNRSFKWGDGLFETMKVVDGRLVLAALHFERLFISLQLLQIDCPPAFTPAILQQQVLELCRQNNCLPLARVRLAVYRNNDNRAEYVIEALPLEEKNNDWEAAGLTLTVHPYVRKSIDAFATIKSANFLPYVLAAKYARETGADDALVLNTANRVCDSSMANIFLIKNGTLITPPLYEGCVNGVMRRQVILVVKQLSYPLQQREVSEEELITADEIFLTNAIQTIRWVQAYKASRFQYTETKKIFDAVRATI